MSEEIDLSMLEGDRRLDSVSIGEKVREIINRLDCERIDMGLKVILESEALYYEDKIDFRMAQEVVDQVTDIVGLEKGDFLKIFLDGVRCSQGIWKNAFPARQLNVPRELQKHPESMVGVGEINEALSFMFSKVLYIPGQLGKNENWQGVSVALDEYGYGISMSKEARGGATRTAKRPNHIYPIIMSTFLNSDRGCITGEVSDIKAEIQGLNSQIPENFRLEKRGLTMIEYSYIQLYSLREDSVFLDEFDFKFNSQCLLQDEPYIIGSNHHIGYIGANVDGRTGTTAEKINFKLTHMDPNNRRRIVMGFKNEQ